MGINAFTLAARKINPISRHAFSGFPLGTTRPKKRTQPRPSSTRVCDIISQHTDSPAAPSGLRATWALCLRAGIRHVVLCSQRPPDGDRQQLGCLLSDPGPGSTRWQLGSGRHLVGYQGRRHSDDPPTTRRFRPTCSRRPKTCAAESVPGPGIPSPVRSRIRPVRSGVATGEALGDGDLHTMDWYVEGVQS